MKVIYPLLFLFFSYAVQAQHTVHGKVVDASGQPILGANIFLTGTYDGTSTAADGRFTFTSEHEGDYILSISFIGFNTRLIPITLPYKSSIESVLHEAFSRLDGVTVNAGTFEASDEKKGTILRSLDIATTAGATADIAGALNTLPGTQKVGETGRLFVRGGEGHETRTFVDGLWVQNPYNSTTDNLPSRNRFSPFLFKGTLFSTGGYSAEYSQALSSTLVLNTIDFPTATQTDISLMTVGGSIAHTLTGEKQAVTAELGYTNLKPYFSMVKQNQAWGKAPQALNASLVYRHKIRKSGLLKVYATLNDATLGIIQKDAATLTTPVPIGLDNRYAYLNISYRDIISKKWQVYAGASYNYSKDNLAISQANLIKKDHGLHIKNTWTYDWSERVVLRFGAESFKSKAIYRQPHTNDQKLDEVILGAFSEADIYLTSKITARAGVRLDHAARMGKAAPAPRVSLAYKTGAQSQISLAYGQFAQQPQPAWQLYQPKLQFELATHYILNYQWSTNDRTFRGEMYHKAYDQLITFQGDVTSGISNIDNAGNGYARGLDLFWRDRKSIKNVDYWISYSYLDTKRQYLHFPEKAVPSFASKHNVSVVYKHFVPSIKTQIGSTFSFTSARTYHDPNQERFNAQHTKPFFDLSINAAYLFRQHIIVYASATNILGFDNVFNYQYAQQKNSEGIYNREPVRQGAPRFIFMGIFITLAKDKTKNQLDNL